MPAPHACSELPRPPASPPATAHNSNPSTNAHLNPHPDPGPKPKPNPKPKPKPDQVGLANVPRFRAINEEVVRFDLGLSLEDTIGGLFVDQHGRIKALSAYP